MQEHSSQGIDQLVDIFETGCEIFIDGAKTDFEDLIFDGDCPDRAAIYDILSLGYVITLFFSDTSIVQFTIQKNLSLSEIFNPSENMYD